MPIYCPTHPYPTIRERLVKMMSPRKNKSQQKPQKVRKVKGRKKPPHRGGDKKGLLS